MTWYYITIVMSCIMIVYYDLEYYGSLVIYYFLRIVQWIFISSEVLEAPCVICKFIRKCFLSFLEVIKWNEKRIENRTLAEDVRLNTYYTRSYKPSCTAQCSKSNFQPTPQFDTNQAEANGLKFMYFRKFEKVKIGDSNLCYILPSE